MVRRASLRTRYQLASVLTLVELATAENCNNISAVYRFAKSLSKEFLKSLGFCNGRAPCYSSLTIILNKVDDKSLWEAVNKVTRSIAPADELKILHMDGKTIRRSNTFKPKVDQVLTAFN